MQSQPTRSRIAPLATALAVATVAALPASSAPSQVPETNVWIDVATHNMVGMPDMGALGGLAARMGGGMDGNMIYPTTGAAGTSGQYLDVAMHNTLNPGVEAQHAIPGGMKLGKSLPLIASPRQETTHEYEPTLPHKIPDAEVTYLEYWGCGASVRPGQPKTTKVKIRNGKIESSGTVSQGKIVPDRDINVTPAFVVWPNRKHDKRVPNGAALAGNHRISGAGVPESLQFDLGGNAEFMPKIALTTQGKLEDAIALNWQPVDRARAYFLSSLSMSGTGGNSTIVVWSSAEGPGAGYELQQYLGGSNIDRWLKEKVLLPNSATNCVIPKGIFANSGGGSPETGGMGPMANLSMIAYGPETWVVYPPKPTDPEALKLWDPEWNLRVRTKSTATAMLGLDMGGMGAFPGMSDDDADGSEGTERQEQPRKEESQGKKLLKGILKNL